MKFGLSESEYIFLFEKLINPVKKLGAKVFIFGSRARGTEQKFSDIDLCYQDLNNIPSAKLYELLMDIEESNFPYKIDLVIPIPLNNLHFLVGLS